MNGIAYPATTPLIAFIQQQEGQIGYFPILDSNWNPTLMLYFNGPLIQLSSAPGPSSSVSPYRFLTRVKR